MDLNSLVFVIPYCSLHKHFINALIEECSKVSKKIVLVVGSHFLDKSLDDDKKLIEIVEKFPYIFFIKYNSYNIELEFSDTHTGNKISTKSRILGFKKAMMIYEDVEWFLFLDSDEIPDGDKLREFLLTNEISNDKNYIFSTYWYFREPKYQALSIEQNPLLVNINNLKDYYLESSYERMSYLDINFNDRTLPYTSDNGTPLFHHYSWVLNKEAMIQKIKYTLKKENHDHYIKLVEEEFSKPFSMKDFIHNYDYKIVENQFNISTN